MRDNAEGAAITTALLNFEIWAGLRAGGKLGFLKERVGEAVVSQDEGLMSGAGGGQQRLKGNVERVCRLRSTGGQL